MYLQLLAEGNSDFILVLSVYYISPLCIRTLIGCFVRVKLYYLCSHILSICLVLLDMKSNSVAKYS